MGNSSITMCHFDPPVIIIRFNIIYWSYSGGRKGHWKRKTYFLFFDDLIMATYSKYLARQLDRTKWGCFLVSKESCRHIVI